MWTVCCHFARFFHLSFFALSIGYTVVLVPFLFFFCRGNWSEFKFSKSLFLDSNHALIFLTVLALMGGTVSLGVIRPDLDDVDYISQAVHFLKHPHDPVDLIRTDHSLLNEPMHYPLYIFYTWELFCAYLALIFHLPYLHVYHIFFPIMGGVMIPLSWFLLYGKFSDNRMAAVLGAAAVCVFLSLNGEPHRSYGNFAFVRIWQGKIVLMAIIVPVFVAFTLDFFRKPIFVNWLRLFSLLITSSGLSAMSSFFMPLLGLVMVLSTGFSKLGNVRVRWKTIVAYGSAYLYLFGIACYFFFSMNKDSISYLGMDGWPETFRGQLKLVFIDAWSYPSGVFVVFVLATFVSMKKDERRFVATWLFFCLILFLNPVVFPVLSRYVTTLNNYWRLVYLLPFPFVVGFPFVALARNNCFAPGIGSILFMVLMISGFSGNVLLSNSHFGHIGTFTKHSFKWGAYKISEEEEFHIRQIIAAGSAGPMLAPDKYSSLIPIFSPDFPQISTRRYLLHAHALSHNSVADAEMKFRAMDYVSGISPVGMQDVVALINRGLKNIVFVRNVTTWENWPALEMNLAEAQFAPSWQNNHFFLYTRNDPKPPSGD